jgi:hypothetical protein
MGAEFSWWLLIVGLVAGGALTWLVLADSTRRERELTDQEVIAEASWIARTLDQPQVDAALAEEVLRAHRRYLGFPPPDVLVDPTDLPELEAKGVVAEPPAELVVEPPAPLAPVERGADIREDEPARPS